MRRGTLGCRRARRRGPQPGHAGRAALGLRGQRGRGRGLRRSDRTRRKRRRHLERRPGEPVGPASPRRSSGATSAGPAPTAARSGTAASAAAWAAPAARSRSSRARWRSRRRRSPSNRAGDGGAGIAARRAVPSPAGSRGDRRRHRGDWLGDRERRQQHLHRQRCRRRQGPLRPFPGNMQGGDGTAAPPSRSAPPARCGSASSTFAGERRAALARHGRGNSVKGGQVERLDPGRRRPRRLRQPPAGALAQRHPPRRHQLPGRRGSPATRSSGRSRRTAARPRPCCPAPAARRSTPSSGSRARARTSAACRGPSSAGATPARSRSSRASPARPAWEGAAAEGRPRPGASRP